MNSTPILTVENSLNSLSVLQGVTVYEFNRAVLKKNTIKKRKKKESNAPWAKYILKNYNTTGERTSYDFRHLTSDTWRLLSMK